MKKILLFLALPVLAIAADQPPRMYRLYQVQVPPDSSAEFLAVEREIVDIYKTNKATLSRGLWTSMTGEPTAYYVVPLSGLTELGETTWLNKQGDEASRTARSARLNKVGGKSTTKVLTVEEAVSWAPATKGDPSAFDVVTSYSVKVGKTVDFLATMKETSDALKKIGKARSVTVYRVTFGGDYYEFLAVTGFGTLADLRDGGGIQAAMGEAAYNEHIQKLASTVNAMHRDIIRYRPEYSYQPGK